MEPARDVHRTEDTAQLQTTENDAIEILRGIRDLLGKIDGKLEEHAKKLLEIEKKAEEVEVNREKEGKAKRERKHGWEEEVRRKKQVRNASYFGV
jgi:hypothetical protein